MPIDDPMFAKFTEHDAAIAEWFSRQGWPVTDRHFDFKRDVFTWRHDGQSSDRTIRVTQAILEDYPANQVIGMFDAGRVADEIARHPEKYLVLRRSSSGEPGFAFLDRPPGRD